MLNFHLSSLPPYGKLFVGLFTSLMLCVCLWAMFILYIERGIVDKDNLPAYLSEPSASLFTDEHKTADSPAMKEDIVGTNEDNNQKRLRRNVGLAHTHINGQTLLFFAIGLVFLFTSAKPKVKKIILWTFSIAVLFHAVGLSGAGFNWFFDDILALTGVVILASIAYMAFLIYVDLWKKT